MENKIQNLLDFFEDHIELSESEKTFISENLQIEKFEKNDFLLKQGQISKRFFFILEGSVRLFYNTKKEEKTAFFYFENSFASSYESYTKQIPAKHNLQALEETEVVVITIENAFGLLNLSPKFEFLARVMMEEELSIYQDIIYSFVAQSAEERYLDLQQRNPDWLQRIPQYQIATFLGVSPETLSRIRQRIRSKDLS